LDGILCIRYLVERHTIEEFRGQRQQNGDLCRHGYRRAFCLFEAGADAPPVLDDLAGIFIQVGAEPGKGLKFLELRVGEFEVAGVRLVAERQRLFRRRGLNDAVGRAIGMAGAISMCTYRVIHRLHHNNLYTEEDPDTAIHGGYPRGTAYLWKKLAQDIVGWNAWKTFAYFFGAPAINDQTQRAARPLDDTSPQLRRSARIDRWFVVAFQLLAPLACFALGGWRGLAQYAAFWLVPMLTILQPILRLRAICEHGATTDFSSPLTAARSNRTGGSAANVLGRALLFPHHVNYHLEHHLYPAVPHYRLPRLHRLLAEKGALDGAEVRDLGATFELIFAPRARRMAQHEPA